MTPDPSTGQILPGSKFGDKLTELAREAKVIVEIGTWKGGGSTFCLWKGLQSESQWMITMDAERERVLEARRRYYDPELPNLFTPNLWLVWGTIVLPIEFPPYYHNLIEDRQHVYDVDWKAVTTAPYCLPIIPAEIDLLLLDGGEWTSHLEYRKLKDRCKVIALDDSNPAKSIKSCAAREDMLASGWSVLADEPDDRNGWFIGRRPR